jgi:glycosyltransferase involved in cell wall biosynthesis
LEGSLTNEYQFGVASPLESGALKAAQKLGVPAYPSDFPGSLREIPATLKAIKAFEKVRRDFQPDLVHSNGGRDQALVIYSRCWNKGNFSVLRTHHAIRSLPRTPYHEWFFNRATALNTFVCHSAFNMATAGRALKLTNYAVVENGVDLARFTPRSTDPKLREQLGLKPDERVFGSCAGLGGYKRVDLILEAAAQLKHRFSFKIIVLGNLQSARNYVAKVKTLNLEDRIIFAGHHEDVRPWCSLFDVGFVLSDAIETISFAAREMLAMGIPLISSTYAGLLENVEDGYNGLRVRPGNLSDVRNAMLKILEMDGSHLQAMGRNARAKAERSFGIELQMASMREAYNTVLGHLPS